MDIALALGRLVPAAEYGGSLTANNQEAYEALRWNDSRPKPLWDDIMIAAKLPPPTEPPTEFKVLRDVLLNKGVITAADLKVP